MREAGGLGAGAGRYSIFTLLTIAIGRPSDVYVAVPSARSAKGGKDGMAKVY